MAVLDALPLIPPYPEDIYTPYGLVSTLFAPTSDPHAFSPGEAGGFLVSPYVCPSGVVPWDSTCGVNDPKSEALPVFAPVIAAQPSFYEGAVTLSTAGCAPETLEQEARKLWANGHELSIEAEYSALLAADTPTDLGTFSPLCAVGELVKAASAAVGTGLGLVHIDALVYLFLEGSQLVERRDGNLYLRGTGHQLVVWRGPILAPSTIAVEVNAAAAIFLSDLTYIQPAQDRVATLNERVARFERGSIIARNTCAVFSAAYDCA